MDIWFCRATYPTLMSSCHAKIGYFLQRTSKNRGNHRKYRSRTTHIHKTLIYIYKKLLLKLLLIWNLYLVSKRSTYVRIVYTLVIYYINYRIELTFCCFWPSYFYNICKFDIHITTINVVALGHFNYPSETINVP